MANLSPRLIAHRLLSDAQVERVRARKQQLETAFRRARASAEDLNSLALLHGTDKSSKGHDYARIYERHFAPRRTRVRRILEIGVGGVSSVGGYDEAAGGQSLRMWADYFPDADIVGIDIYDKEIRAPRIHFEQGDQGDSAFLRSLIDRYGPFDIVIDDGSHIGRHIITSISVLWEAVVAGGFYVIEDLSTAYDPVYEGGPPGTPGTAADLLKIKIDDTLRRQGDDSFRPSIAAMHVYPEIVFLEKSSG